MVLALLAVGAAAGMALWPEDPVPPPREVTERGEAAIRDGLRRGATPRRAHIEVAERASPPDPQVGRSQAPHGGLASASTHRIHLHDATTGQRLGRDLPYTITDLTGEVLVAESDRLGWEGIPLDGNLLRAGLSVRVPGYVTLTHPPDPWLDEEHVVLELEGDAEVRIQVIGDPDVLSEDLAVSVKITAPRQTGSGSPSDSTPAWLDLPLEEARAIADLALPSGHTVDVRLVTEDRAKARSARHAEPMLDGETFRLVAGERRDVVLDAGSSSGRMFALRGIPLEAAANLKVRVRKRTSSRADQISVERTDAEGVVFLPWNEEGPITLSTERVGFAGREPIRDTGPDATRGQTLWYPAHEGAISVASRTRPVGVLRPSKPLVALRVLAPSGHAVSGPLSLRLLEEGPRTSQSAQRTTAETDSGVLLFHRSDLSDRPPGTRLQVTSKVYGLSAAIALDRLLAASEHEAASLFLDRRLSRVVIRVPNAPNDPVWLRLRPLEGGRETTRQVLKEARFTFTGIEPGAYLLVWGDGQREVVDSDPVHVEQGQDGEVTRACPDFARFGPRAGRVVDLPAQRQDTIVSRGYLGGLALRGWSLSAPVVHVSADGTFEAPPPLPAHDVELFAPGITRGLDATGDAQEVSWRSPVPCRVEMGANGEWIVTPLWSERRQERAVRVTVPATFGEASEINLRPRDRGIGHAPLGPSGQAIAVPMPRGETLTFDVHERSPTQASPFGWMERPQTERWRGRLTFSSNDGAVDAPLPGRTVTLTHDLPGEFIELDLLIGEQVGLRGRAARASGHVVWIPDQVTHLRFRSLSSERTRTVPWTPQDSLQVRLTGR